MAPLPQENASLGPRGGVELWLTVGVVPRAILPPVGSSGRPPGSRGRSAPCRKRSTALWLSFLLPPSTPAPLSAWDFS